MNQRKHYSSEQKVLILRELLENNIPISHLAEKFQVHVNDIYNWRKKLFENAKDIFQPKVSNLKHLSAEQTRIAKLESKLKDREEAIAFLVKENIDLKKSIDGEI
ncbi:MAG: transposase [Ignavibacteriales bacterium]|nr:transposase [Ignavibacteriales bacterium]